MAVTPSTAMLLFSQDVLSIDALVLGHHESLHSGPMVETRPSQFVIAVCPGVSRSPSSGALDASLSVPTAVVSELENVDSCGALVGSQWASLLGRTEEAGVLGPASEDEELTLVEEEDDGSGLRWRLASGMELSCVGRVDTPRGSRPLLGTMLVVC